MSWLILIPFALSSQLFGFHFFSQFQCLVALAFSIEILPVRERLVTTAYGGCVRRREAQSTLDDLYPVSLGGNGKSQSPYHQNLFRHSTSLWVLAP